MVTYPYYSLNGVPLSDPAGRWYEAPDHSFAQPFPGLRSSSNEIMGVSGERAVGLAPMQPGIETISMHINAVDGLGNRADGHNERGLAIMQNLRDFYRETGFTSGVMGAMTLTKHFSNTFALEAEGRIEASSKVLHSPGDEYATMEIIYRIHSGTWRDTDWQELSMPASDGEMYPLTALRGDAPIQDALVRFAGPVIEPRIVTGYYTGFQLNTTIPAGQFITVNTARWSATLPYTNGSSWGTSFAGRPFIQQIGPPNGALLTLFTTPTRMGYAAAFTGKNTNDKTHCVIRTRGAYV